MALIEYLRQIENHPWDVMLHDLDRITGEGSSKPKEIHSIKLIGYVLATAADSRNVQTNLRPIVTRRCFLKISACSDATAPDGDAVLFSLALNLLVIALNGELMPISPETVERLAQNISANAWHIGSRPGTGKDIVSTIAATRLERVMNFKM